jgi:endonuclease/exonuclease/phosphatase family metal-dependent hydrolase
MARLRLLTFNVAHGRGTLPVHQSLRSIGRIRSNLLKIAALIKRVGADVVALQEVDENSRWNGSFNHLTFLSEHCGLPFTAIGLTNERAGNYPLNYGNGVLSRWPIMHAETITFGRRQLGDKGFLFIETELEEGLRLPLISLHLHHTSRKQRLLQAGMLMKFMTERRSHRSQGRAAHPVRRLQQPPAPARCDGHAFGVLRGIQQLHLAAQTGPNLSGCVAHFLAGLRFSARGVPSGAY